MLLSLVLLVMCGMPADAFAQPTAEDEVRAVDFVEHGVEPRIAHRRGVVATESPDGEPLILAWLNSRTQTSLLAIHAETGETEEHVFDGRGRGRAFLLTDGGQFYLYGDRRLLVYDVNTNELHVQDGPRGFAADGIVEGDDGTIYFVTRYSASVLAYDPRTGELESLGSMAEYEHRQYPRNFARDDAGWLYAGFGRNIVAAFNPQTGESRILADEQGRGSSLAPVFRGEDGAVYGRACASGLAHIDDAHEPWQRFYEGQGEPLDGEPGVEPEQLKGGSLYIDGHYGGIYRQFPDGRYLRHIEFRTEEPYAEISSSEGSDETETITFSYGIGGRPILSLTEGPRGYIYGGGPRTLFRYHPDTDELQGTVIANGQLDNMTSQGGYLFAATYNQGELFMYDPDDPWPWDGESGDNPHILAHGRNRHAMITRPYLIEAHPDGNHVIMGGYYDRENVSGGGLIIYHMETEAVTKLSKHDLRVGHNPRSMTVLPDGNLLIGTDIGMRGRADIKADRPKLLILDLQSLEVIFEDTPFEGADRIRNLVSDPDTGLVFGITHGGEELFFVFDPETNQVIHRQAPDRRPLYISEKADNGRFYLLCEDRIVEVDATAPFSLRPIGDLPVAPRGGFVIHQGRAYFGHEAALWSARLQGLD